MPKPIIAVADLHLIDNNPQCRTDDAIAALFIKLEFVKSLQAKLDADVIIAGDVFDYWDASHELVARTIPSMPARTLAIPGQHDLPQHRISAYRRSALHVLEQSGRVKVACSLIQHVLPSGTRVHCCPYGTVPSLSGKLKRTAWNVMVYHGMVWDRDAPYPGAKGYSARELLRKNPQADFIITGDNHKTFTAQYKGRWLVNPGSVLRSSADQMKHKPCVFVLRRGEHPAQVFLPHKKGVVSRDHIEQREDRENKMEAFIRRVNEDYEIELSFEKNMNKFLDQNRVRRSVRDKVGEAMTCSSI